MRPKSILLFERLFLGGTALVVLNILFHYNRLRDYAIAQGVSPAGPIVGLISTLVFNLLFWFFIARRASGIARWIFVALLALGMIGFVADYRKALGIGASYLLWSTINAFLQLAAAGLLFRGDAAEWFRSKGRIIDPRIFE